MVIRANNAKAITYLAVGGLRSFDRLDASGSSRRFRKEVLRVGTWKHPATGEEIDLTSDKLDRLASNTAKWLGLGHKVHFPNGHTDDVLKNLGWWKEFSREGDSIFGVVEIPTAAKPEDDKVFADIAAKIGTTIQDVSPGIWWDAISSATGEKLAGGVLEHVCATPVPVIDSQSNFHPLSRAGKATRKMLIVKLNRTALAKAPDAAVGVSDAVKLFLGLPADAADADVIEALRNCLMEDEDDDSAADGVPLTGEVGSAVMSRVSALEKELEGERAARAKERLSRAAEKVAGVKAEVTRLGGRPIPDEKLKKAESFLSSGDESIRQTGDEFLSAHREASLARTTTTLGGTIVLPPDEASKDDDKKRRHDHLARTLESQGKKTERNEKGHIVKVDGKSVSL